jgi:hypothetical protein
LDVPRQEEHGTPAAGSCGEADDDGLPTAARMAGARAVTDRAGALTDGVLADVAGALTDGVLADVAVPD